MSLNVTRVFVLVYEKKAPWNRSLTWQKRNITYFISYVRCCPTGGVCEGDLSYQQVIHNADVNTRRFFAPADGRYCAQMGITGLWAALKQKRFVRRCRTAISIFGYFGGQKLQVRLLSLAW